MSVNLSALGWSAAAALAAAAAAGFWGDANGYARGLAQARAQAEHESLAQLTATLQAHRNLLAASAQAGQALREQLAQRELADEKSTTQMRAILAPGRAGRADCRFDADSMRLLRQARDAAAAAAAGGVAADRVQRALPGAGVSGQRSP